MSRAAVSEPDPGRSEKRGSTSGRCSRGVGAAAREGLLAVGIRWRSAASWLVRAGASGGSGGSPSGTLRNLAVGHTRCGVWGVREAHILHRPELVRPQLHISAALRRPPILMPRSCRPYQSERLRLRQNCLLTVPRHRLGTSGSWLVKDVMPSAVAEENATGLLQFSD